MVTITIKGKIKPLVALSLVCLMSVGALLPITQAADLKFVKGFDKGPSYEPVVPMKRVTFVNFDENSFLDDYAYLAAVPTAVFNDGSKLFSNPLLFYQDEYPVKEDKELSLNARQGIDYFMEDWMAYCNGQLDKMTLVNVPKDKLDNSWTTKDYTMIESDDPYDIASEIALSEWSYSDNAVIAVIEDQYEKTNIITEGTMGGSVPAYDIGHQQFEIEEPVIGTGGTYKYFDISDEHYKYIAVKLSWPNNVDYDLQLYDTKLGMVDNGAGGYPEQLSKGLVEIVGSYIHNHEKWGVSVTAVPVKGIMDQTTDDKQGGFLITALKKLAKALKNTGTVDISLYPETMINIAEAPFGCRDVDFTLTWNDPNKHLGFTLIDPVGTEICSSLSREEIVSGKVEKEGSEVNMHVDRLGECSEGDKYSICVFSLDDVAQPVDFTLKYSWHQNFSKIEGEYFASASNGAVLASTLNAPLLYVSPSGISGATKNILYKLGVKNIYLVNIGGHISKDAKDKINEVATITEYNDCSELYKAINEKTGNNGNIVFTTIDPWTYAYATPPKPAGEYPSALFVGPAAYIAAHHGSPVLIVDLHPKLSQATVYPTDSWLKGAHWVEPVSGSMLMSGRQVYDFLEEYGLGKLEEGNSANQIKETIITVADQYDIGTPWDRMFTGAAYPGRFCFSPVDTAYWISRNVFYPAMIFINPAMQGEVKLINGSSSKSKLIGGRLKEPYGSTLVITKPSMEEQFTYPILHTYTTYGYKFNEKASKHWNYLYSCADGVVPYITPSLDPIDDGATGKPGAYYPDMSESEVIPFYAKRAGYENVFSTNFDASVENLNRGVLIWVENCHGSSGGYGVISMWDPDNPYVKEENPWRAYEPILLYPGHLREFLRWILPGVGTKELIKFHILPEIGSTENPDVACVNTQRVLLNKIASKLHLGELWGTNGIMIYRDRLKHPLQALKEGLPLVNIYDGDGKITISPTSGAFPMIVKNGIDFDNALENLHSCGLNTISCLPACTYLHLTWMRHGMVYQIIDPWVTTDWAGVWTQMLIKRFAMGDTIGQAYERGMRACGPEFLVGQWWWDKWENVELFGDPSLRVFVPGTDYSDANHWEKEDIMPLKYDAELSVNGHMPFGVTSYPHAKTPVTFWQQYLWLIVIIVLVVILIITVAIKGRKKK